MSNERNRDDTWNATRDPGTIREWGEERGIRPYRRRDAEEHEVDFHRPEEASDRHEEVEWNRLGETMEERDLVFLYGDNSDEYELVSHDDAIERATMESDAVEEALLEGETVETEVVETKVVETEVVEHETIESEVVDTELLGSEVIESEVVDRNVIDTRFTSDEMVDDDRGTDEIPPGRPEDLTLEADIEEVRAETREQFERVIVESEVVESDVVESDTVETDAVETTVDVEGVERHLLQSDVVGAGELDENAVDTEVIESRMKEGDIIETEFVKRTLVEEEVVDEYRNVYDLEDSDRLASDIVETEYLESAVVGEEAVPAGEFEEMRAEPTVEATAGTAGRTSSGGAAASSPDEEYAEGEAVGTGNEPGGSTVQLTDDDVGKTVVDEHGTDVGIVSDVEASRIHVNPESGIAERIKSSLGWGDADETYAIGTDQIDRIDDDEVTLRSI
ncbi:hypothetical protein [Halostella pelagica]|uniref:hypothetical protein n=1 Tax=Halostella pelagica TaxID=2583824 RepID=UPI001081A64B|nr:hypothetical protein [Halostella pelagica]